MSFTAISLTCPSCGALVSLENKNCDYCNSPLIFSEFNSFWGTDDVKAQKYLSSYSTSSTAIYENPEVNFSAGMCCLKLRLFDKAFDYFDKAISFNYNNCETFFFAAVSLLDGKKAFLSNREKIDKIEKYIKAAIAIEPRGIFYYFWAYIKYDYFKRKFLNTTPDYKECLLHSAEKNTSDFDKKMIFDIIGAQRPIEL